MLATRFDNKDTNSNLQSLLALIYDSNCKEVRLFASPAEKTDDFTHSDGPDTNLPLVAALARYSIPGVDDVYVVFDGLFLTAARQPRRTEVAHLLDAAEASGKTYFVADPVPFTSAREPLAAAQVLLAHTSIQLLTTQTRSHYFASLSNVPESQG